MKKLLIILLLIVGCVFADVISVTGFKNNTSNPKNDWIGESIADNITSDLVKISSLNIVNRKDLKKILQEQKFQHSGLVDLEKSVEIGEMVGATKLIAGDYSVVNGELRINVNYLDVESGITEKSISKSGKLKDLFYIQNLLVLDLLKALNFDASEIEEMKISQLETEDFDAIENNYKGVLAVDNQKIKEAIEYFEKAVIIDPYYQEAKLNYETTSSMVVSGARLFADIETELQRKESQLAALKLIMNEFINTYWKVEITSKPTPITEGGNTQSVDIKIPIKISVNIDAVEKLIVSLKSISKGNTYMRFFDIDQKVVLYKENWEWLKNTAGLNQRWFEKSKKIVILENDTPLIVRSLSLTGKIGSVAPGERAYMFLSKPTIRVDINHKDLKIYNIDNNPPYLGHHIFRSSSHQNRKPYPVNTHLLMKNIPISKVKRITSIEVR